MARRPSQHLGDHNADVRGGRVRRRKRGVLVLLLFARGVSAGCRGVGGRLLLSVDGAQRVLGAASEGVPVGQRVPSGKPGGFNDAGVGNRGPWTRSEKEPACRAPQMIDGRRQTVAGAKVQMGVTGGRWSCPRACGLFDGGACGEVGVGVGRSVRAGRGCGRENGEWRDGGAGKRPFGGTGVTGRRI